MDKRLNFKQTSNRALFGKKCDTKVRKLMYEKQHTYKKYMYIIHKTNTFLCD